jgi:hypothetical protein
MYGVDGSPIWSAVETLPEPMTGTDKYIIDGQINTGLDSKTSQVLATFDDSKSTPAIVSTFDGQVIVNGYSPSTSRSSNDKDDFPDAAEILRQRDRLDRELRAVGCGCAVSDCARRER